MPLQIVNDDIRNMRTDATMIYIAENTADTFEETAQPESPKLCCDPFLGDIVRWNRIPPAIFCVVPDTLFPASRLDRIVERFIYPLRRVHSV